jgi:hypothetical protein
MTKIYVVTSGEYSSYGINAVFSTSERAIQYGKESFTTKYEKSKARIEIYDMDNPDAEYEELTIDGETPEWRKIK